MEKIESTVDFDSVRERLAMLRAFVADDSVACTYQSLGQYRAEILRLLNSVGL